MLAEADSGWTVREHTTRYRAIRRAELTAAAEAAGFADVAWPEDSAVLGGQQVMTAVSGHRMGRADGRR